MKKRITVQSDTKKNNFNVKNKKSKIISFLKFVQEWNKIQEWKFPRHHKEIVRWLTDMYKEKNRKGLLLAFRGSGKSSIVALFAAWILHRDNDVRILILSADERLAKKMSNNIKKIIMTHPITVNLKPTKKDNWSSTSFTINREKTLRDASVMAVGISGNITGSRADVIICDDVEVPKNCNTFIKRENLREKLSELEFILTPGGLILYVGTPHTHRTIYKTM
ncbi:MAG: phage terminase large subunit [Rickettsiales bacterium]|jgi:hypothetical protein|nr:phage terminase large subunit [Rickettsiales bacterium]